MTVDILHLTQQNIAALLGVSPQAVRARNPPVPRNQDGSYDGPVVMKWQRDQLLADNSDDEGMLIRYKALRQGVAYEKELGLLVDRDTVAAGLRSFFSIMKQCGERLQKNFGHEAYNIFTEALNEAESGSIATINSATSQPADVALDDEEPKRKPKANAKSKRAPARRKAK